MIKDGSLRLLWLFSLIGNISSLTCLIFLWAIPSSENNAIVFGLSIWRLAAGLILICGFGFTGKIFIAAINDKQYFPFKQWIIQPAHYAGVFGTLLFGIIFILILILFQLPPVSHFLLELFWQRDINWYRGLDTFLRINSRLLPVISWLFIIFSLAFLLLIVNFWSEARKILTIQVINKWLLVGTILLLTFFHWATILLQLKFFLQIPGWKWWFTEKEFHIAQWAFLPLVFVVLLASWLLLRREHSFRWKWLLIFAFGYLIQVVFGFFDGGGWESLRLKYADSVFNRYALVASGNHSLVENLRNYETWYGNQGYLETKPPGILIPYYFARTMYEWFHPGADEQERFWGITQVAAYLFPLSGYLVVFILAKISKKASGFALHSSLPGLLFITCPSVILIPVFLDQALFPLLFLLLIWMGWQLIETKSNLWGFILGCLMYAFLYISFSLLPFVFLFGIWMALNWIKSHATDRKKILINGVFGGLGFLVVSVLFYLLLQYDPLIRYTTAMIEHRETRGMMTGFERVWDMFILNNAEMFVFTGFPMMMLFIGSIIRNVFDFVKNRKINQTQMLLVSFVGMIALLNLFSQTMGEVQRLWLFLVPMISFYSANGLNIIDKDRKGFTYLVILLQLTTAFLLYRYQDFYG